MGWIKTFNSFLNSKIIFIFSLSTIISNINLKYSIAPYFNSTNLFILIFFIIYINLYYLISLKFTILRWMSIDLMVLGVFIQCACWLHLWVFVLVF